MHSPNQKFQARIQTISSVGHWLVFTLVRIALIHNPTWPNVVFQSLPSSLTPNISLLFTYIFTEDFEIKDKLNWKRLVNLSYMRGGYGSAIGTNFLGTQAEYHQWTPLTISRVRVRRYSLLTNKQLHLCGDFKCGMARREERLFIDGTPLACPRHWCR